MADLKTTNSILDGITCYETVSMQMLDKLINSTLLQTVRNKNGIYRNDLEDLLKYKKKAKTGTVPIKYAKSKKSKYGRVYPEQGLGFHMMRRAIRHTLAKDKYVDIDIENASPTMLHQLCVVAGIPCEQLASYVTKRERFLKKVMKHTSVSRSVAKMLVVSLLFGGSFESWCRDNKISTGTSEPIFCYKLGAEIKLITMRLIELNPTLYAELSKNKENKGNLNGSFLNNFLFEHECRVLECIFLYLQDRKVITGNNCALCADGILIEASKYDDGLLSELSEEISKRLGFDLTFVQKEMTEGYTLAFLNENQKDVMKELSYSAELSIVGDFRIKDLQAYFREDLSILGEYEYEQKFKSTKSFKYFNYYHFSFYTTGTLFKNYCNDLVSYNCFNGMCFPELRVGKKTFAKLYLECSERKQFNGFIFDPRLDVERTDDKYNNFTGFFYDIGDRGHTCNMEIVQPMIDHIRYVVDGHQELMEYLINWMAHIIQRPHVKTEVAIILYSSEKGIGKNVIVNALVKLLKGYTTIIPSTHKIGHNFNADMVGKLLVEMNELDMDVIESKYSQFMDMITRPMETIEYKGIDKKDPQPDYKNYITTDNDGNFPISQGDRKFQLFECTHYKKSFDYYEKMYAMNADDTFLREFYYYLKEKSLAGWKPQYLVNTDYTQSLILRNMKPHIKFLLDDYESYAGKSVSAVDLFKAFDDYAKATSKVKGVNRTSDATFYKAFKAVFHIYNVVDKGISKYEFFTKEIKESTEHGFIVHPITYEQIYEHVKSEMLFKSY